MIPVENQITNYINSQPETKKADMQQLHQLLLKLMPKTKLWFSDGKNHEGKIVTNPNIGYGTYEIQYANKTSKSFYKIGISATTTGISIYLMGLKDTTFLKQTYASVLGKASITGYCIKFKKLKDIRIDVLQQILEGII